MLGFVVFPFRKRFSKDREYHKALKTIFGIYPNNIELYKLALIHRSASLFLEDGTAINNERLEFLGDAVIEAIVSDYLFIEYPDYDEGTLTRLRARIVSRATLNQLAIHIGLDKYIIVQSGGNFTQRHLYGDALEAMIGAVYLDKGYDFTNRLVINRILRKHIDLEQITETETDFKSRLIEWCQKNRRQIVFDTVQSPESTLHEPRFSTRVLIDNKELGTGEGPSKITAEQEAAAQAKNRLEKEFNDTLFDSSEITLIPKHEPRKK